MRILLITTMLILGACEKKLGAVEFCEHVTKKPQYAFLFDDQKIASCEVVQTATAEADVFGEKIKTHKAVLKLVIEQVEDDCVSEKALRCGMLNADCLMVEGKKASACRYPDARVQKAKGTKQEMRRSLVLATDNKSDGVEVFENKELK